MMTPRRTAAIILAGLLPLVASAQSTDPGSRIRGLVKPETSAVVSSQIPARIDALPFKDGERFNKGDLLVKFDCSLYDANLRSAGAEYRARSRRHANNAELEKLEAIADIEVKVSRAEMNKAAADVQAAKVTVKRCEIHAPFSGRVASRDVNPFESVTAEQPLMTIIDDSQLEIELIVPSRWLRWLDEGTPFKFQVDETGDTHEARIKRMGASVDPVSQTIRVTGVLPDNATGVLAGMSGTALFENAD